nr:retrotransposon protein, putative, Ty1-copia subclass [Tanacetum cinerariifolium]
MEDTLLELLEVCRQKEFYCMHNNFDDLIESSLNSKLLSINLKSQRLDKKKQEVKNVVEQPTKRKTRIGRSLQNFRVVHKKSSISLKNMSLISPVNAITPVLPTEDPEYSLSMGYEHLSTTPETETDKVIESSVKNLLPIPREYEVTSEDKSECDMFVYKDSSTFDVYHYEILSDSNNDDILSNDDAFEDIEYVEASPLDSEFVSLEEENDDYQEDEEFNLEDILQIQDVILREKLLSINRLIADIESLNENPTPDPLLNSSASFPIFKKSDNSYSNNSLPELEETRSEVDLFLTSDNSIPPGIGSIDYDSEGDIYFLKELLVDDFIPFPKNKSSDFDHQDDPSFPRPPSEPPDVESFFDLEPNSGEVILAVKNNIDELNEDECFDLGREINVFSNVKDDDFFPFIFVIRVFLPYLIYPEVFPLLLSAESEDTILTLTSPFRVSGISLGWNLHYVVSNKRAKLNLDSALLWHCRLRHISKKHIEKLQHDGLLDSTDIKSFEKYVSCMSGKMARKPYSHQVERAKDVLGLINTDICGPFKIMSRQGANYFVTFTDDFSRYGYVYLLKHIHEVFETFKVFQKEVENQLGKTIKSLRSNRGGKYMSQEFLDHLNEHKIIAHRTPPYTPQHNGVSERRNKTLLDMVRSMMSQTTLPKSF